MWGLRKILGSQITRDRHGWEERLPKRRLCRRSWGERKWKPSRTRRKKECNEKTNSLQDVQEKDFKNELCPRGQKISQKTSRSRALFLKNNLAFTLIFFENWGLFPRESFRKNVFSAGIAGAKNRVSGAPFLKKPKTVPFFLKNSFTNVQDFLLHTYAT